MSEDGGIIIYSVTDDKPRLDGMPTFMIKQDGGVVLLKQFDYEMTEEYVVTVEAKVGTGHWLARTNLPIILFRSLCGFKMGGESTLKL